jgi:hypothetical protein
VTAKPELDRPFVTSPDGRRFYGIRPDDLGASSEGPWPLDRAFAVQLALRDEAPGFREAEFS